MHGPMNVKKDLNTFTELLIRSIFNDWFVYGKSN